jgi:hypothetical protein
VDNDLSVSPKIMLSSVVARTAGMGWSFNDLIVKDSEGALLGVTMEWPPETFGSATYATNQDERHTLLWSTYYDGKFCKVTGGLYIKQYIFDGESFEQGARRVRDELWELFNGDNNLCVVLCLEDDEIDVAPGIIGRYREAFWRVVRDSALEGILTRSNDEWVEVQPESSQDSKHQSVSSMNEKSLRSLLSIQSSFDAELWGRIVHG